MKFPRNARIFRGQLDAAPFAAVFFLLVIFLMAGFAGLYAGRAPATAGGRAICRARTSRRSRWPLTRTGGCISRTSGSRKTSCGRRLASWRSTPAQPLTLLVQADKEATYEMLAAPQRCWRATRASRRRFWPRCRAHLLTRPRGPAMISASVEPRPWPRRRWWILVALVFGVQLGLIFWLSDRRRFARRRPPCVPALQLAGDASAELLALKDPTLFALPHRQGFSGAGLAGIPPAGFRPFDWSERPRWLPFRPEQLGRRPSTGSSRPASFSLPLHAWPDPNPN